MPAMAANTAQPEHPAYAAAEREITLFGLQIADTSLDAAARWIVQRARHKLPTSIAFLNAHCVNVAYRAPEYRAAMETMDLVFADGIGVRLAARAAGIELQDNVNGTDLFPVLCREAAKTATGLFLLGAREGIAKTAGERMRNATPGLVISGTHHGYISDADTDAHAIAEINASGAGIVLVALGVPTQELWIARNRHRLTAPAVIGVGGLFDYYSGRIARAPVPLRKAGLEWAWRLAQEPRRLARRYLVGNAEFMLRLAWLRLMTPAAFRQTLAT